MWYKDDSVVKTANIISVWMVSIFEVCSGPNTGKYGSRHFSRGERVGNRKKRKDLVTKNTLKNKKMHLSQTVP